MSSSPAPPAMEMTTPEKTSPPAPTKIQLLEARIAPATAAAQAAAPGPAAVPKTPTSASVPAQTTATTPITPATPATPTTPGSSSRTPHTDASAAPATVEAAADSAQQQPAPVTPASPPRTRPLTPAATPTPVRLAAELTDSVQSFSSDGTQMQPPPTAVTAGAHARRRCAPPPPRADKVKEPVAAAAAAAARATRLVPKKRKRGSPAGRRTARVDEFFKPLSATKKAAAAAAAAAAVTAAAASGAGTSAAAAAAAIAATSAASPRLTSTAGAAASSATGSANGGEYFRLREMIDRLTGENLTLRAASASTGALRAELDDLRAENEDLQARLDLELPDLRQAAEHHEQAARAAAQRARRLERRLADAVVDAEAVRRERDARRVAADAERLGRTEVQRVGTSLRETWRDGSDFVDIEQQLAEIGDEREAVERKRKEFARRRRREGDEGVGLGRPGVPHADSWEFAAEQEEVHKVRLMTLRRDEAALVERRAKLGLERNCLLREMRRQSDERQSAFCDFPMLNGRYQLTKLLGKGGFSEVFKAVDVRTGDFVACKIHQLGQEWSEEKKVNFIRHAKREYEIHKALRHPRVVMLLDIFDVDENCFCTVLEFCDGSDLETHLRAKKTLPEREAKSIIAQVFSALLYLSEQKRRVIHYDLKPGNILLKGGDVQITDFGLSKMMGEGESTRDGMELTSQGAGTMWYLPPECFETGGAARINSKVDVWSAGVILFQMLYGRKPFGHDQSQEKMYREKTAQHQDLVFPAKPTVSDEAKAFVRVCLQRKTADRPDVRQAVLLPFIAGR